MRVVLFHNPSAGSGEHQSSDLVSVLSEGGMDVIVRPAHGAGLASGLAEPADLMVVAGGDGTVRKVLTRLPDRTVPVAILPMGTANNIARFLGSQGDVHDLAESWRGWRVARFDIGRALGPWGETAFVEAVGYGAIASITGAEAGGDAKGDERLAIGRTALQHLLESWEPPETTVEIDGTKCVGRWLAVEILNTGCTGPGLRLCPSADPGDAELDVLCVGVEHRADILKWIARPEGAPPGRAERGRRIRLDWDCERPLRIDDTAPEPPDGGGMEKVTVELQDRPLSILVPPRQEKEDS